MPGQSRLGQPVGVGRDVLANVGGKWVLDIIDALDGDGARIVGTDVEILSQCYIKLDTMQIS